MPGVYRQVAGERPAQRLVGRDQGAQPFVDLSVLARAALLDGLHHQQADAHADQRDQRQAQQCRQQALPGTEIQITHAMGSRVASTAGQSRRQVFAHDFDESAQPRRLETRRRIDQGHR